MLTATLTTLIGSIQVFTLGSGELEASSLGVHVQLVPVLVPIVAGLVLDWLSRLVRREPP